MKLQEHFTRALFDAELAIPPEICTWNQSDPTQRFAIYRNNVIASLVTALVDTFPVCFALVGEEFFRAMARIFVQEQPPKSRILAYYGGDFAHFIAQFPPAASVPYLADIARLEYARVLSFHARDESALTQEALTKMLANPSQLPNLVFEFQDCVHVLLSDYAIASIWAAHQDEHEISLEDLDPNTPESALIMRHEYQVEVFQLSRAEGFFVQSLMQDASLSAAAQAAFALDSEFDLSRLLHFLMQKSCVRTLSIRASIDIEIAR